MKSIAIQGENDMRSKIKTARKFIVVVLVMAIACALLTGCGHTLSGKYTSESGKYSVKFESNKECTWYQNNTFFDGKYYWDNDDDCYYLEIEGKGLYMSTIFTAEVVNDGLIIDGGTVDNELFQKDK